MTLQERIKTHIQSDLTTISTAITNDDYSTAETLITDIYNDVINWLTLNGIELTYPE